MRSLFICDLSSLSNKQYNNVVQGPPTNPIKGTSDAFLMFSMPFITGSSLCDAKLNFSLNLTWGPTPSLKLTSHPDAWGIMSISENSMHASSPYRLTG